MIQIIHRRGRILPIRIRKQKHLHPRHPKLPQHGQQPIVQHQILLWIPVNLILNHPIPMTQINTLPHLPVNLLIRLPIQHLVLPKVLHLDQRREQMRIHMLKQRIHIHETPLRKRRHLIKRPRIHVLPHGTRNRLKSVIRHPHVLVPIDLQKISALRVDDQPAHPERVIVLEVQHLLGVSQGLDELLLRAVEGELIELRLTVLGEGVIHVESDGADVVEAEFAVAEYVVGGDGTVGGQVGEGGEGEVHFGEEGGEAIWSDVGVVVVLLLIVDVVAIE
mmetsp:Transcript_16857/g.36555  ORF Transcript_16857/g.36555 Transcript_16857/m.36555 type:complete len:277 (-) Transcript_16857:718-1548(-)